MDMFSLNHPALEDHNTYIMKDCPESHRCLICKKAFSHSSNVRRHITRVHGLLKQPLGKMKCSFNESCESRFVRMSDYRLHLENVHKVRCEAVKLKFSTFNDFLLWKQEEELRTKSHFVAGSSSKKIPGDLGIRRYYMCNRSGHYFSKGTGKRRIRVQGSVKINACCPARMEAVLLKSSVIVIYIKTHVGHDLSLTNSPLVNESEVISAPLFESTNSPAPKSRFRICKCDICDKVFSSSCSRRKHMKELHGMPRGRIKCSFDETCKAYFDNISDYMGHLKCIHELYCEKVKLKFSTFEDFLLWKKREERRTKSRFVCNKNIPRLPLKAGTQRFYVCNRYGTFSWKSDQRRLIKMKNLQNIEFYCPAKLELMQLETEVCVTYYKTHVGHKCPVLPSCQKPVEDKPIALEEKPISLEEIPTVVAESTYADIEKTEYKDSKGITNEGVSYTHLFLIIPNQSTNANGVSGIPNSIPNAGMVLIPSVSNIQQNVSSSSIIASKQQNEHKKVNSTFILPKMPQLEPKFISASPVMSPLPQNGQLLIINNGAIPSNPQTEQRLVINSSSSSEMFQPSQGLIVNNVDTLKTKQTKQKQMSNAEVHQIEQKTVNFPVLPKVHQPIQTLLISNAVSQKIQQSGQNVSNDTVVQPKALQTEVVKNGKTSVASNVQQPKQILLINGAATSNIHQIGQNAFKPKVPQTEVAKNCKTSISTNVQQPKQILLINGGATSNTHQIGQNAFNDAFKPKTLQTEAAKNCKTSISSNVQKPKQILLINGSVTSTSCHIGQTIASDTIIVPKLLQTEQKSNNTSESVTVPKVLQAEQKMSSTSQFSPKVNQPLQTLIVNEASLSKIQQTGQKVINSTVTKQNILQPNLKTVKSTSGLPIYQPMQTLLVNNTAVPSVVRIGEKVISDAVIVPKILQTEQRTIAGPEVFPKKPVQTLILSDAVLPKTQQNGQKLINNINNSALISNSVKTRSKIITTTSLSPAQNQTIPALIINNASKLQQSGQKVLNSTSVTQNIPQTELKKIRNTLVSSKMKQTVPALIISNAIPSKILPSRQEPIQDTSINSKIHQAEKKLHSTISTSPKLAQSPQMLIINNPVISKMQQISKKVTPVNKKKEHITSSPVCIPAAKNTEEKSISDTPSETEIHETEQELMVDIAVMSEMHQTEQGLTDSTITVSDELHATRETDGSVSTKEKNPGELFECHVCKKTLSRIWNLRKHLWRFHKEQLPSQGKILCSFEENCEARFNVFSEYRKHLFYIHGLRCIREKLTFSNFNEFLTWKAKEERKTNSSFVPNRSLLKQTSESGIRKYYICDRSGYYSAKNFETQGEVDFSAEVGNCCPATMDIMEFPTAVFVTYFKTHVGHELVTVDNQFLTEEEQAVAGITLNISDTPVASEAESGENSVVSTFQNPNSDTTDSVIVISNAHNDEHEFIIKNSKSHECHVCKKTFSRSSNLRKHLSGVHNERLLFLGKMQCSFKPTCKARFGRIADYRKHLQYIHNKRCESVELSFHTFDEFLVWKVEEERKTRSYFVTNRSIAKVSVSKLSMSRISTSNGLKRYYMCNRSGYYSSKGCGMRRPRLKGSVKIDGCCPATMDVTELPTVVNVIYFKTHVGHDLDISYDFLMSKQSREVNNYSSSKASKTSKKTPQECFICAKIIASGSGLIRHVETVHKVCSICKEAFSHSHVLKNHMRDVHGIQKQQRIKCHFKNSCKAYFNTPDDHKNHLKQAHGFYYDNI